MSRQFFKILKSENARDFIRPVGYHTKKFNVTEARRPIYQKELFSIYSNLKAFSDIMQQNRTLLLTDSLPCVQILRSAKTKDSTVYSLLVKLAGEYPNIMVNHCKGGQNISDLFSRQGTHEKDAFLEFKLCHLPREKSNEKIIFSMRNWKIGFWIVESSPKLLTF